MIVRPRNPGIASVTVIVPPSPITMLSKYLLRFSARSSTLAIALVLGNALWVE